ncbi:Fruiting body protein SC3 [Leucoagaricus sp. SymC.cos]|nr:Fruiting body protein SC3 [Leucoagaricus sp. SymC.cos]
MVITGNGDKKWRSVRLGTRLYSNIITVVADHRLALEFKYPAGAEDILDAIKWAVTHPADLVSGFLTILVGGEFLKNVKETDEHQCPKRQQQKTRSFKVEIGSKVTPGSKTFISCVGCGHSLYFITALKMFFKVALFITSAFALTVVAAPGVAPSAANKCSSKAQCCNQIIPASDAPNNASLVSLLGLIGVAVKDLTANVGLQCTTVNVLGLGGDSCNAQTVCCENNNFSGVVALGCTPIGVGL